MSEKEKKVVDDATDSVSDGSNQTDVDNKENYVKYETYDKVLNKLKKVESMLNEKDSEIISFKNETNQKYEQELAEKGEYKKLLEIEKQKNLEKESILEKVSQERDYANDTLIRARKEQAVAAKLSGKVKKSKYFDFINIDEVVLDPETGLIDEESASLVANKFVDEYPELIQKQDLGHLPNNAASNDFRPGEFKNVPIAEMRKKAAEAIRQRLRK